jgi:DNA polymerase-1
MDKLLVLIDGNALVYKSYFGYIKSPLANSKGEQTSAPYGVAHTILKVFNVLPVTHIAVIFDPPGGSFRKALYPDYKANRVKHPEVLPQLARSYELVKAWGIYTSAFANYEADDAIGSLATKAIKEGFEVKIITKDKDFTQLIQDGVKLIDLGEKISDTEVTELDQFYVINKFGVKPEQMIEYLAIVGDSTDNVKGIPGIGPKGAVDLLKEYGNVDTIYKNLDKLKPKMREKFEINRTAYDLSKTLVTIVKDIDIQVPWEAMIKPTEVKPELLSILQELEFETVLKELGIYL